MPRTETIAANIQSSINDRGLPFPMRVTAGSGNFITITIRVRASDGRESAEHTSFPAPRDPVIMGGAQEAISKMVTRANMAQHIGMEVF